MAAQLPCQYADLVKQVALARTGRPPVVPADDCDGQATHRVRATQPRPGTEVSVTSEVCVWHAELARQTLPGFVYPPTTIPGVVVQAGGQ